MRTISLAAIALLWTSLAVGGPTRVLGLDGTAVDPLAPSPGTVATVLVFTTTDCPISGRYAPEIRRLSAAFGPRGVKFVLVYPVVSDTPELIKANLARFGYHLQAVRDTGRELVALTGATVTPEVAVADARGRFVYNGRIDDRYIDFGRDRPVPTRRDLEQALDDVMAGRPVSVPHTQAVGCILSDLLP